MKKSDLSLVHLLALVACVFLIGCSSVRRGDAIGRPITKASAEVERGRVVYQQQCYRCHPGGEGGLGPSLNDKPLPAFLIRTQIRAGMGVMPGFDEERISPEQMSDLMTYIFALRNAEPVTPVKR